MSRKTRDLLALSDLDASDIMAIVERAQDMAAFWNERRMVQSLAGYRFALVVNDTGWRKQNHPCETLGDLAFLFERRGHVEGMKVGVVSPKSNILGSWIEAAATLPINVVQVYPGKWHDQEAAVSTNRFRASNDMNELLDVDVIVTDCWPSDAEPEELLLYQITPELLDKLHPAADFVPCPPVTRGKEVSTEAMKHRSCRVTEAKAFLLHAQNAVLEWAFAAA